MDLIFHLNSMPRMCGCLETMDSTGMSYQGWSVDKLQKNSNFSWGLLPLSLWECVWKDWE
jgi:hypothetical protein